MGAEVVLTNHRGVSQVNGYAKLLCTIRRVEGYRNLETLGVILGRLKTLRTASSRVPNPAREGQFWFSRFADR
jgi:hypothetical protein